jgi:hypothetical protein
MVPFFRAKTKQLTHAKFAFYFDPEQRFEQGAGGPAEGACESEIAYRVDMALLSRLQPSRPPAKIELPKLESTQKEGETKKRDKQMISLQQMFMSKDNLFIYKRPRGQNTDTHKNGPSAQLSSGRRSGGVNSVQEEEFFEGLGERPGGVSSERIHTLHRHLVLDALGNDVALRQPSKLTS